MIATGVGGIPGQIEHGRTGFLTDSAAESADVLVELEDLKMYGDLVSGEMGGRRAA